jgi:beta-mannanase
VSAFEQSIGAPVGIASFYNSFLQVPALQQMHQLLRSGTIPMVNMKCGAPDDAIAAGLYDTQLRRLAILFKDFTGPIFFRWFWEMNLSKTGRHAYCLGESGAAGYIAAFRHIWEVFHSVGAINVAFVWAPSDANGVGDSTMLFWPGVAYVDWIGADLYDRAQVNKTFGREFDAFYRFWHAQAPNTPIMISETGAVGGGPQRTWLKQIAAALTRKVYMTRETPFTQVHAIVYVDAVDKYDYILEPGSVGHLQFSALIHHQFFEVRA